MTYELSDDPATAALVQLIERVAGQDAAALHMLYQLTSPKLFGIALRILGHRDWAEDVLQDAFINIWRFAGQYQNNVSAPMAWMAAIVRNGTFDYLRQRKALGARVDTRRCASPDDESTTDMQEGPFERVLLSQQAKQLANGMTRLEARQRRAVTLAYLCDLSHAEVAEIMNAPLGTVKGWIRRGTQNLKPSVEEACAGGASVQVNQDFEVPGTGN